MNCLDDNGAAAFVQGLTAPEAAGRVEAHLESCATCRELIVTFGRAFGSVSGGLATEGDSGPRPLPALQRGERLDRYVVLECVGTGAMSVVYAAYDPELDRKVALKVMRAASGHDRLLVEARAIAKLSHPNIVSVFDARVLEGDLFIAMELVVGPTLRQWLATERRGWRDALGPCLQAARGLAAAHRAGIVHRDFKPENVLVGPEGLVKVVDFGLAMRSQKDAVVIADDEANASWPVGITRTGSVVGTPLYMAPELMDGGVASPASDQFALCVVLHEALLGRRPFVATDFAGLRREKRDGPASTSDRAGVPRELVDAIRRGLAPRPEQRWPSIDALLERLSRARTRVSTIAAGVVALGIAGALAMRSAGADSRPCTGGTDAIASTWDATRRAAVDAAMRSTGAATDVARVHALDRIDAWSHAWVDGWTRACRATRVDGVQSADLLDRRMACLERGRAEMDALVELLARGEPDAVARAGEAVDALRDVDVCADVAALLRRAPEPPDSELARATAARIAEARAHRVAGRYADAVAIAALAHASAQDVGDRPMIARARLEHAHALAAVADASAAEEAFVQSIAESVGADDVAAEAWVGLLAVIGRAARFDEAERIGRFADAALARVDDPAPLRRKWWLALGAVALARGEYDLAQQRYEAAHELAREVDDPIGLTDTLEQLARVELARGRVDAALAHMDRVLELRTAELGEHHPRVADALVNYGNVLHDAGRWDDAGARFEAAAVDLERALGSMHPSLAGALAGRAVVARRRGDLTASRRDLERVLAIREAAFGTDHPEVAHTLVSLANVDYEQHDWAEARRRLDRALAIYAHHFAGDHPRVIAALANLASVDTDAGLLPEAERTYRRVLATRETKLGAEHPEVAFTLANLGRVVARRGRADEARALIERALAIALAKLGETHPFVAFARDSLAEIDDLAKEARP